MGRIWKRAALAAVMLGVVVLASGCAYFKDRGGDALDIFDVGFTFTAKPRVAAYVGFQSLLSVGYIDVEGKLLGIGNARAGWHDMEYKAAGMILDGHEQWSYSGSDISENHRHVSLRLLDRDRDRPTKFIKYFSCPKLVHVGFIGLNVTCNFGELLDFVIGWSTLDIAGDDLNTQARRSGDVL